ncbi:uncharacterized protein [Dermacentor andersoni]|uniref:uncharacterized protein n=1 Tax=Dermacentor andersoni TaxID=34620 RepID=UPI003B3A88EE
MTRAIESPTTQEPAKPPHVRQPRPTRLRNRKPRPTKPLPTPLLSTPSPTTPLPTEETFPSTEDGRRTRPPRTAMTLPSPSECPEAIKQRCRRDNMTCVMRGKMPACTAPPLSTPPPTTPLPTEETFPSTGDARTAMTLPSPSECPEAIMQRCRRDNMTCVMRGKMPACTAPRLSTPRPTTPLPTEETFPSTEDGRRTRPPRTAMTLPSPSECPEAIKQRCRRDNMTCVMRGKMPACTAPPLSTPRPTTPLPMEVLLADEVERQFGRLPTMLNLDDCDAMWSDEGSNVDVQCDIRCHTAGRWKLLEELLVKYN